MCFILKSNFSSQDFVELSKSLIKIKNTFPFYFIDIIGEFEILSEDQIQSVLFDDYAKFFSWRDITPNKSVKKIDISNKPMNEVEKISFALFKLLTLPPESKNVIHLSQKRRLENICKNLISDFSFNKDLSYEQNLNEVLICIDKEIKNLNHTFTNTSLAKSKTNHIPFNGKKIPQEAFELLSTSSKQFIEFHWNEQSDFYNYCFKVFFYFQWKNYFVNTFRREINSKETIFSILEYFNGRLKNEKLLRTKAIALCSRDGIDPANLFLGLSEIVSEMYDR